MDLPRVFIPQLVEKYDSATGLFAPAFDFTGAAAYGTLTTILEKDDNPLFLAHLTPKINATLAGFNEDDFFVAVGDPSVIAVCAGIILRSCDKFNMLKWDKKQARYIVLEIKP